MPSTPSTIDPAESLPITPAASKKSESTPTDLALKVFGVVGTGIGILGFVTFFGGAIIWLRADKAELPATEAVAVIPRSVLVTTGATFLFPAVLIALGIMALVWLIDLVFYLIGLPALQAVREQAKTFGREAAQRGRAAVEDQRAWQRADAALQAHNLELEQAHARKAPGAEIADLQAAGEEQKAEAGRLRETAGDAASAADTARVTAEDLVEQSEVELQRSTRQWWIELGVIVAALLVVVPFCNGAIRSVEIWWEPAVLIVAALSGTATAVLVYRATENVIWFGIVAFLAVGVYLAAATYLSTHRNAKMQPVAALWSGHAPLTGSFVSDTSQSLYVGTFAGRKAAPRLVVIPRDQVTQVEIGPLLDQDIARVRAIEMALIECRQRIEEPAADKRAAVRKPACRKPQVDALSAQLAHAQAQLDQPG
jgi:hypothetical protein